MQLRQISIKHVRLLLLFQQVHRSRSSEEADRLVIIE